MLKPCIANIRAYSQRGLVQCVFTSPSLIQVPSSRYVAFQFLHPNNPIFQALLSLLWSVGRVPQSVCKAGLSGCWQWDEEPTQTAHPCLSSFISHLQLSSSGCSPQPAVPDAGSFIFRTSVYRSAVLQFAVHVIQHELWGSGGNSVWGQGKHQSKHSMARCWCSTAQPPAPSTARAKASLPEKII